MRLQRSAAHSAAWVAQKCAPGGLLFGFSFLAVWYNFWAFNFLGCYIANDARRDRRIFGAPTLPLALPLPLPLLLLLLLLLL